MRRRKNPSFEAEAWYVQMWEQFCHLIEPLLDERVLYRASLPTGELQSTALNFSELWCRENLDAVDLLVYISKDLFWTNTL